jgi:hypothetical protein
MTTFNQVFQTTKNTVSVSISDWEYVLSDSEQTAEEDTNLGLEFNFDPLAFILSAENQKFFRSDIHYLLETESKNLSAEALSRKESVLEEIENYETASNDIQRYYQNKMLLWRIKGFHFSKFQENLEKILENPKKIKKSQLRIMLRLHDFYNEDRATEELFKNHKSINGDSGSRNLDDEFVFVKTIERFSKNSNITRYYFKNSNKNLLLLETKTNTSENNLIDYLSRQSSIVVKGPCVASHQQGHEDFVLYKDGNFKFYDPESGK